MRDLSKASVEMRNYFNASERKDEFSHLFSTWQIAEILKRFKDMPQSVKDLLATVLDLENRGDRESRQLLASIRGITEQIKTSYEEGTLDPEQMSPQQIEAYLDFITQSSEESETTSEEEPEQDKILAFDRVLDGYVNEHSGSIAQDILQQIDASDYIRIPVDPDILEDIDQQEEFVEKLQRSISEFAREIALFQCFAAHTTDWIELPLHFDPLDAHSIDEEYFKTIVNVLDGYPFPVEHINAAIRDVKRVAEQGSHHIAITAAMIAIRESILNPESDYARYTRRSNMLMFMVTLQNHGRMFDTFAYWYASACASYWEHLNEEFSLDLPWIDEVAQIAEGFKEG